MELPGASAANSSLTLLGRVTDLIKKGATIELQEAIQTLRAALLAEKEEKLAIREELANLKSAQEVRSNVVFEDPVYYLADAEQLRSGPYCAHCFGKDMKLAPLSVIEEGAWKCSVCKESFETQARRQKRRTPPRSRAVVSRGPNSWLAR